MKPLGGNARRGLRWLWAGILARCGCLWWAKRQLRAGGAVVPLMLHRVLAEETYSWNWHYYQVRQTRVERGDVVLDCGAAEGFFSLKAIEQGAGRVICIESHPICAHCG